MADCLYECLREARLEHYYPKLEAHGITMAETLSKLTMNDYTSLGICSLEDKKRLFRLIQIIRAVQGPDQPSRSLGQGQSKHQASQRPPQSQNKESNRNTSISRQKSKNTQLSQNHERTEPNQNTSQESNKENVGAPSKPSLSIPSKTVIVKGAGTSEKKPMLAMKSVTSPAKSDVSVTSSKGLNIVAQETPGKPTGPAFIERIVHNTGYNYGLPNSSTKPKTSSIATSQAADQANSATDDAKIKVCVRKRPLSKREIKKKDDDVVRIENRHTIVLVEQKVAVDLTKFTQEHAFIYDEVFHESMTNKEVYERTAKHLIKCVFSGGMATCFVYGQTGAGKTHTIMGNLEVPGLYLLAAQDIFNKVCKGHEAVDVTIWVSYFEIYCGQLFDLLNKRKRLQVREDGSQRVNIAGLSEVELGNVQSLMEAVQHGNKVRSTGVSGVNPDSSRSHAVLQIELRNNKKQRIGKISFIDLAGSERAADVTDADKQNRLEGADINQSLLALKECIRALDQESRHTPFRQSKLTHILKDSFIGNCRTCMIANISPCQSASENTLNTLRYADRVKELRKELSPKTTPREDTAANARSAITKEFPAVGKMTPSVFHPSSVPLSSTPLRPNKDENAQSDHAERETGYSQFESPICGHKIRPRKLVNALTAEEDNQPPVKESQRKVCAEAVGEKESVHLNVALTSDKGVQKRVSGSGESEGSVARKISDVKSDSEKPMDISTSSVNISTDSRTSQASRVSRTGEKPKDKVRNPSSDGAGIKMSCSNNSRRAGTEMLKPKQGDNVFMESPLNLSVLKQGKFDKQTGLIARLEKAMEKTREALNRSLTSHDLMAASEMEKDDGLFRGDEAPPLSEKQVVVENKTNSKSKYNGSCKDTDVEKSPILVEKFSKSGVLNHPVKSFMQAAKNSPVTKEKMAKLVRAQKEAAGKTHSVKKVSRTPTKMIDRPMPDPKVMESKPDHEQDINTSQEVSPSKRRRMVSPPEPELKTSTDFDDYLAKALHDTGNKRNKLQVYDGKFLPGLQDVTDQRDTGAEEPAVIVKKSGIEVKELSTGVELVPGNDHVDGVKTLNISNDSQTSVVKRSLLSEFRETVVIGTNPKSPVTKTFLSPRKLPGVGQDLIASSSPIKKFNSERQQPTVYPPSDQNGRYDRSTAYSGFDTSSDKTLTENSKVNALEKSPDTRRPKLLDRDTGDLYTMSQSPQKSPRMAAKVSQRMQHLPKLALGQVSEASKKISSLPTPDEFLKSLAGKRSSVRKSRGQRSDVEPKSECLDRPKFKANVEPKSESGAVKKDRAKWERPAEHMYVEPRNSRLLAHNQRPTWIKPEATKRLSLTKMLDNPPDEGCIELENDKSELIQNFYSKLLKYNSIKDKALKDKSSDSVAKSHEVCSTVSDSAILKNRMPSGGKPNRDRTTEFSEKIPVVSKSKTVTDSGVVIPGLSLEHNGTTETESDVETASIGTLDDVSSIASVRSLPVNDQLSEDTRQIVSEPLPPHPPVDLQKTACSAWKKTAPVKPKPIKPDAASVSPKKGVKKVTCTAPIRPEKLDPLSSFLPIHPYPVTPSSNDVLTAPKVITKIVVADDSKDKTGISENLDDSEIVRTLDNATNHEDGANRASLVNSLSTIGKALQQSKISMAKELSKTTNCSRLNRNHADPLSQTIGYSSYCDSGVLAGARKTEKVSVRNHDSSRRRNDATSGKSLADKDPLRNTIGVSSGKFLTNGDQLSSRSSRDSYRWRDPAFYQRDGRPDKVDLNPSLERSFEARQQLGESLRSTYDSAKLRSTLNGVTMTRNGSTLRETTIGYHSRHSTVESKSDVEGGKTQSHHARIRVISGHEEHLADVTAMCRREMSLLKQVRSGEVSFSDYTNRMTDMLLIKLKSIELLRDRIACCKVVS